MTARKRQLSLLLEEPDDQVLKKKGKKGKKIWSDREKAAVERHLGSFMTVQSRLPGKNEIEQCLKAEPALKHWSCLMKSKISSETKKLPNPNCQGIGEKSSIVNISSRI